MNFIIKLPKSTNSTTRNKYNSILIMINKLIKYLYIIACKEKFIAILNRLIRYHDILKGLTSDKDKLFTSNY